MENGRLGHASCSASCSQCMRDASICGLGQAAPNPLALPHALFPRGIRRNGERARQCNRTRTVASSSTAGGRGPRRARRSGRSPSGRDRDPASLLLARARLSRRRQLPRLHGRDRGRARARRLLHPQARRRHEGGDRHARAPRRPAPMVFELLVADQPARETSHDPDFEVLALGRRSRRRATSRFPAAERWAADLSHPAMRVNLDACIQCNLCVRACREVQVNDVIGMAYRGRREDRLRLRRPDGRSRPASPAASASRPARPAP